MKRGGKLVRGRAEEEVGKMKEAVKSVEGRRGTREEEDKTCTNSLNAFG